ncbi:MAG: hypothetical protein Q8Q85_12860 [Gemmatimonadales bacterium]|nr:hypothetical protein [Gemmatimonadales bacterium]
MPSAQGQENFDLLADIPIDEVQSTPDGFVMQGRGADRAGYRLEMHIDWPVDPKTKAVLGEILSQTEVRVMRWRAPGLPMRRG